MLALLLYLFLQICLLPGPLQFAVFGMIFFGVFFGQNATGLDAKQHSLSINVMKLHRLALSATNPETQTEGILLQVVFITSKERIVFPFMVSKISIF